jgi:hypothetical protein
MTTIEPAGERLTKGASAARAAVLEQLSEYWSSLPRLSAADPETLAFSRAFIGDDYVVRFGDMPLEAEGDEMLAAIAAENDEKWVTHVRPRYVLVDVEEGRAAAHFHEKLVHPQSGGILREMSYFSHMEFTLEDGRLKLHREHLVEVPAKFRSDVRPGSDSEVGT